MRLEQQLAEFKEPFLRTAPAGRPALYEVKIDELRTSLPIEAAALGKMPLPARRATNVKIGPGVGLAATRPSVWLVSKVCSEGSNP